MIDTPKRIVFLDLTTPKPYNPDVLANEPLGGSEATMVRVAERLASLGLDVIVAQHCIKDALPGQAKYVSFDALDAIHHDPHAVIAFRSPKLIPFARNRWTDSKLFLWCEDFNENEIVNDYPVLEEAKVKILGCSRTHKTRIADALLTQVRNVKNVTVDFVYNPIDDELVPNDTPVYQRKLVFFSSPHKGLDLTLEQFRHLRSACPMLSLYVANPGYLKDHSVEHPGVVNLGALPHNKVIQHVREAFCVFHMNDVFPETFGIVHSEANAVGTPVLTSTQGANREIIEDRRQFVNVRDTEEVCKRFMEWQEKGRPEVKANPEFRLSNVITQWRKLLNV